MAANIKDTTLGDLATAKRGKGRPKGAKNKAKGDPAFGPEMATVDSTRPTLTALIAARDQAAAAGHDTSAVEGEIAKRGEGFRDSERAPSFGHNEPDVGVFLQQVHLIRRQGEVLDAAKLVVKTERGKLKDIRTGAREMGLVMRELDDALEALNTERVDLIAREKRRRLYMEWLGLDLGEPQELAVQVTDEAHEASRWFKRGDTDGRLGKVRAAPEGIPGEHLQDYLKGHEAGQLLLMKASPLTAGAFQPKAADVAPKASEDGKILILKEEHFAGGTALEDANLKTLMPDHMDAWQAADRVVAVFGGAKRILREPEGDGWYEDTGEDDVPVSEPEVVVAEAADLA